MRPSEAMKMFGGENKAPKKNKREYVTRKKSEQESTTTASGIEVRGDAQFALGQMEQARTSYSQALAKLDVASPQRRLLELKLTEVGGTPAKPEAKS